MLQTNIPLTKLLSKTQKWKEYLVQQTRFFWEKKCISSFLCFHNICNEDLNIYSITEDNFISILQSFEGSFRNIGEVCSLVSHGVVLSFDDGFCSTYEIAFPILRKYKIPFIVYVSTDYIGRPGYLSKEQVFEMSKESQICEIGSHMCSHRKTREMTDEEIMCEWGESKLILESIIGKPVIHAALPYGSFASCSMKSIRIGLKVGYRTVATTHAIPYMKGNVIPRFVYKNNKPFNPIVAKR